MCLIESMGARILRTQMVGWKKLPQHPGTRDLNNKSGGSGQALFMELQFEQVTAKVQIDAVKADNMTYK